MTEAHGTHAVRTRVVLGILALTTAWSVIVVLLPELGFMVGALVTLLAMVPGAIAVAWAVRVWRRRPPTQTPTRLALLLVPMLVLATTAALVLDDGYRDAIRWRLSWGSFHAAAAELATSTPEVGTFHGARRGDRTDSPRRTHQGAGSSSHRVAWRVIGPAGSAQVVTPTAPRIASDGWHSSSMSTGPSVSTKAWPASADRAVLRYEAPPPSGTWVALIGGSPSGRASRMPMRWPR